MTPDTFGQHCLRAFARCVPARSAAFYRVDARMQAFGFQLLDMQRPMHDAYLHHYRHLDPLRPSHCAASGLAVVPLRVGQQCQSDADNRAYQDFLRRHSVVDVVEIVAHLHGRPAAAVSLLRDGQQGFFSRSELASLESLHALMQSALHILPAPISGPTLPLAPGQDGLMPASPASPVSPAAQSTLAGLTARERQIALLLREGASNKTLARRLDIGLPTVKTHLLNLYRKAGVNNRTELVGALFLPASAAVSAGAPSATGPGGPAQ